MIPALKKIEHIWVGQSAQSGGADAANTALVAYAAPLRADSSAQLALLRPRREWDQGGWETRVGSPAALLRIFDAYVIEQMCAGVYPSLLPRLDHFDQLAELGLDAADAHPCAHLHNDARTLGLPHQPGLNGSPRQALMMPLPPGQRALVAGVPQRVWHTLGYPPLLARSNAQRGANSTAASLISQLADVNPASQCVLDVLLTERGGLLVLDAFAYEGDVRHLPWRERQVLAAQLLSESGVTRAELWSEFTPALYGSPSPPHDCIWADLQAPAEPVSPPT